MSDTTAVVLVCFNCGLDLKFLSHIDCEDGKRRCFSCWVEWLRKQGIKKDYVNCDDCGQPLVKGMPIIPCVDYKIRCVHCYRKKYGVSAS